MTATSVEDRGARGGVRADEIRLVALARGGDDRAFGELASAYRAELRAHCYRMTGSVADAEDAVQEGLLRAWRGLAGFQGRGSVRSWLYAIVTNAAVDLTRNRSRRELPVAFGPGTDRGADLDPPLTDQSWLDPYPDDWLTRETRLSPEARYEQRESVERAFLVALQQLPALPRAALLLREVVGFSTAEIAGQLGTTAAAVNSALQRARAAIRRRRPAAGQQSALRAQGDERTNALVQRYADAIERGDADALISMLTADATWSMPPVPMQHRGHQAVRQFLISAPLAYSYLRSRGGRRAQVSPDAAETAITYSSHMRAGCERQHQRQHCPFGDLRLPTSGTPERINEPAQPTVLRSPPCLCLRPRPEVGRFAYTHQRGAISVSKRRACLCHRSVGVVARQLRSRGDTPGTPDRFPPVARSLSCRPLALRSAHPWKVDRSSMRPLRTPSRRSAPPAVQLSRLGLAAPNPARVIARHERIVLDYESQHQACDVPTSPGTRLGLPWPRE